MANALTGEFDVVAEFATLAANRVLAAMHRAERFPHSMSLRVDDNPVPQRPGASIVLGVVDEFGGPPANQNLIGAAAFKPGRLAATSAAVALLDPVVNADAVAVEVPPVPSHLQGRAQLQLAPPTIEVAGATGASITVKIPVRARYFPDANTSPAAEFVRGDLQITARVDQVAAPDPQNLRAVLIDVRGPGVTVNFSPTWSSRPLSVEDLAGINLLIHNALRTGFLPSSNRLPDEVNFLQFKTLHGSPDAITVLLNLSTPRGNPASMNNVFLRPGDDFALAVGRDFIMAAFPEVRDDRVQHHGSYDVSNIDQTTDLQDGQLLFKVTGHVHRTSWPHVSFDFTATQALSLIPAAATAGGPLDTAEVAPIGDVSLEISGGIVGWILNQFKGFFVDQVRQMRDDAIAAAQPTVRAQLNIDTRLGPLLRSLLEPPTTGSVVHPLEEVRPVLAYSFIEIRSSGIIPHGTLAVADWPPAHVEFEQIPVSSGGPFGVVNPFGGGPDYSALNSWIPGGTIQQYEWGQAPRIDENRFVLLAEPPEVSVAFAAGASSAVSAFQPLCLTVRGTRLSASGPVVSQPVSATACTLDWIDILSNAEATSAGAFARVTLTQPRPGGPLEVVGHAPARLNGPGGRVPNRIVHFADDQTAGSLEFLTRAMSESGRTDAPAVVLAVLTSAQLTKSRHVDGVIYAEEADGAWERAFGLKMARRPATVIVAPDGKELWRHEGHLDSASLATRLRRLLVSDRALAPRLSVSNLRIGRLAPNFVFDLAAGPGLTLRKLAGRPVNLVFWNSSSKASIEAVRELQKPARASAGPAPVVLAINDGDAAEVARRVAEEHKLSATIVTDPKREISVAYGASVWPTTVFLDALGLVRNIRYGRFAAAHVESPEGRAS
ncbi:MAG TPA: TlpA disulfide reductase family protein [Polyangia bacterium]|nr:TlpA disulfide reductase family protein [Polyangia bacterium]